MTNLVTLTADFRRLLSALIGLFNASVQQGVINDNYKDSSVGIAQVFETFINENPDSWNQEVSIQVSATDARNFLNHFGLLRDMGLLGESDEPVYRIHTAMISPYAEAIGLPASPHNLESIITDLDNIDTVDELFVDDLLKVRLNLNCLTCAEEYQSYDLGLLMDLLEQGLNGN